MNKDTPRPKIKWKLMVHWTSVEMRTISFSGMPHEAGRTSEYGQLKEIGNGFYILIVHPWFKVHDVADYLRTFNDDNDDDD